MPKILDIHETALVCAYNTSTTSLNTTTQAESTVLYTNKEKDDFNMYNTSTGIGTIQKSGWYEIKAQAIYSSTSDQTNRYVRLAILKNGSIVATSQEYFAALTAENRYGHITRTIYFTKNDTFAISISGSQQQGAKSLDGNSLTNCFSLSYIRP